MVIGGQGFLGRRIVSALFATFTGPLAIVDVVCEAIDPRTHFYHCDITDEAAVYSTMASVRISVA